MTRPDLVLGPMLVAVALAFGGAAPAHADEAPPRPKPTAFGAEAPAAPLTEVAPGDFEGLLRNCDIERGRAVNALKMAEQNASNMPFLTGAYLALWAILLAYFVLVARRQKRMHAEMQVLRERLARLGDDAR